VVFLSLPITHQLPYAGVVLMFFGGAAALLVRPRLRVMALFFEAAYFLAVWAAHPLLTALRIETTAAISFGISLGGVDKMIDA